MDIEEAKRRARSGPMLLLARRAFALVLTFVSTVSVARLVAPEAYGLANMALVILAFAQVFRDFGLTNAVLRKGVITAEEMTFIFWFNAATTVVLALLIAAVAPLAGSFYDEPIVTWIVLVALIGFLCDGLSGQHRALISRDLRFATIAIIDSGALAVGFITTLLLAVLYHNVWAIVLGSVAQSGLAAALTVLSSGWKPGPPRKIDGMASLLKFGANSSIFSVSVFLSNNSAPVLIGHFLGASQLGQFNRADALKTLPMTNLVQPITQATMPLLTRLRGDPAEYRAAYLALVRKLCTVLFPVSAVLTFSSLPLVEALLGPQWESAGRILSVLAPTLLAAAVASAASDLFITQDRADELRTLGLAEAVLRVGAIAVAVRFGVIETALAFTLSTFVAVSVRLAVAGRSGPVNLRDQLRATLPGVPLALGSAVACIAAGLLAREQFVAPTPIAIAMLLGGAVGGVLVAAVVPASRAATFEILELFGVGRLADRKKRIL